MKITRLVAACTAVVSALALSVFTAVSPASAETVPSFDFSDCPALPAGADPKLWRCEVLVSTGTISFGTVTQSTGTMRLTFAEGRTNGTYDQVFGALRGEATQVDGGLLGVPGPRNPLLDLRTRPAYAGYSDFLSVGDRMGEIHLRMDLVSPLLPANCSIGTTGDAIVSKARRTAGPDVISTNPLVMRFDMVDTEFAAPRPHGCGAFTRLLQHRLGVPSAAGTNTLTLRTYVSIRNYG